MAKGLDFAALREIVRGPNVDTRQWGSYGIVEAGGISFDDDLGPLIRVKLQPMGQTVMCRVGMGVAGDQEGEWTPMLEGDEVFVGIPGDEKAGCIILARCSNSLDKFPRSIVGQDPGDNNFAFRRTRVPYVFENTGPLVFRDAKTKAYWSRDKNGRTTIVSPDGAYFSIDDDFATWTSADASIAMQLVFDDSSSGAGLALKAGDETQIVMRKTGASFISAEGTLSLSAGGNQGLFHLTTIEQMIVFIETFMIAVGTLNPGILTGAGLIGAMSAASSAALATAGTYPLSTLTSTALAAALALPRTATTPNVGSATIFAG